MFEFMFHVELSDFLLIIYWIVFQLIVDMFEMFHVKHCPFYYNFLKKGYHFKIMI